MDKSTKIAFRDYLFSFISENKKVLIAQTLSKRTRYITPVLEDIYNSFNTNAVLRSADCFGIQDIHLIENKHEYEFNPHVAKGAVKWLNVYRHKAKQNNTMHCINELKSKGYRIVATTPHTDEVLLPNFDIEKGKFAVVFGSEQFGVSELVKQNADEFLKIPMYGFTESYNISVSAALCFYELTKSIQKSTLKWQLNETEQLNLEIQWAKKIVSRSHYHEKEFIKKLNKSVTF